MKIGIIITCKNLVDMTRGAYESIATSHPHETIIVDDHSNDGTKSWLVSLAGTPHVHTLIDPPTSSLSEKWNLGISRAIHEECEAFLVCNNDIVFHPLTIDALIARLSVGDVGLVSAHNRRGEYNEQTIAQCPIPEAPTESEGPDFSCFLLARSAYTTVGPFDEGFIPCYFEDNDYHYRLQQAGLRAIGYTGAPYFHYGSRTQNSVKGGICPPPQFERNRSYFVQKHGVDPTTYRQL